MKEWLIVPSNTPPAGAGPHKLIELETESIPTEYITNCLVHHGPGQDGSTAADPNQHNITGSVYRASVTSVRWDVCTESRDTKRQHPPRHSLFTLLPSDNRYRSICCCTSRLHSSFTPHTDFIINTLWNYQLYKKIILFCHFFYNKKSFFILFQ